MSRLRWLIGLCGIDPDLRRSSETRAQERRAPALSDYFPPRKSRGAGGACFPPQENPTIRRRRKSAR